MTLSVNGATQTFAYSTAAGGNADTISDFMLNFNSGHYGVTASFDATAQRIAFTRDPNNVDAVHRGKQGANPTTADFTISDSLGPAAGTINSQGTTATGLLETLGATNINGVVQTPANAFGAEDNGGANALVSLFARNVGVGALQTTAAAVSTTGSAVTITQPAGSPGAFSTINVGQVLTIVNAVTGTTQNVPVTAINRTNGTVTVTALAAVNVNDSVTTAATQTLGGAYQGLVSSMGADAQTALTGGTTQTALAASIDQARQSVDGINIDDETQDLLKFQSAYTAAAKTMSTINAMMQTSLGLISGG